MYEINSTVVILMQKLPSMKLLVTFESAARNLSFKQAAEELFVSPSAVSHQIRTLEKDINTQLFVRKNRFLELTQEGREYYQNIEQAIYTIKQATESIMLEKGQSSLVIHSFPYLANFYIVPNLKDLKSQYPTLNISIESQINRVELHDTNGSRIHVAIRHGKDSLEHLQYDEIAPVSVSPVCAPDYVHEGGSTQVLLTSDNFSWQKWQSDWGIEPEFTDTIVCDGMQAAVNIAEQGLGLTMGYFPFFSPKIHSGELILPYPNKASGAGSLYLVYLKQHKNEPIIKSVRTWLSSILVAS